jgi:hypothetical protein
VFTVFIGENLGGTAENAFVPFGMEVFLISGRFSKRNPAKSSGLVIALRSIARLCNPGFDGPELLIM